MSSNLIKTFQNPGSTYRGAPFWAWNGKLNPDELRNQIRIMKKMGLGGFFMHSRVGLDTAYLSRDWFKCVNACVDEAKKLDMNAWLYDEDRWPSGAAGGFVTKNPEYRARSLVMTVVKKPNEIVWDKNTLAVYTAKITGNTATDLKKIKRGSKPAKDESIIVFNIVLDSCSNWYNGFTYLDTMNHQAVKEFIKVTHEAYLKNCGKDFAKTIPGIFTDEPNYGRVSDRGEVCSVPWTKALPSVFKKRYGYDITAKLPEIFFNINDEPMSRARYHYHDCITFLFTDAFGRQIGEWCEKNKIEFTGHALAEETLSSQNIAVGSAMRFYEHMQAPGMDILTEHKREYDTAKLVSSAAHQFGRKRRLTETYGCTGWDFNFAGHKSIGDWQTALGINLRCQHLSWYTMKGQAKRDYPAGIFYQSPWWESYPKVEDYFARINSVMFEGSECRNVLVLYPVETMWTMPVVGLNNSEEREFYDNAIIALRDSLLFENIDFDYGDEDIIARHAAVTRKNGKPAFRVNKASYNAVILPPMKTIRSSTLKLLKKFRESGGTVVFAGRLPEYVDAEPSNEAVKFAASCRQAPEKGPTTAAAVEEAGRLVSIRDNTGKEIAPTLHLLKETGDAYHLFICNTGHSNAQIKKSLSIADPSMIRDRKTSFDNVQVSLAMESAGQCLELNPETGEVFSIPASVKTGSIHFQTSLPALGSRLFRIPKKRIEKGFQLKPNAKIVKRSKITTRSWSYALTENNALVLDMPKYKIGKKSWQKETEILRIDHMVRTAINAPQRGGQMVQPWAREKNKSLKTERVELEYSFDAGACPSGDFFLGIECPETFEIQLNGNKITVDAECGWWCDKSLRKIPLDNAFIKKGENKLTLVCDYNANHPGFEIIYLLGNFGVQVKGAKTRVTSLPEKLRLGDWVKQGLPFYSGSVVYSTTIKPTLKKDEKLFVHVPEYKGTAARIMVNEKTAGIIAWEPNELEITDLVKNGPVELKIEILGHRRNSHGPLHHVPKWPNWTGPHQFETSGPSWSDNYQLVPCGLMNAPELVVKRTKA